MQLRNFLEIADLESREFVQTGNRQCAERARQRLTSVLDAWEASRDEAVSTEETNRHDAGSVAATFRGDFFSWASYFETFHRLAGAGLVPEELRSRTAALATANLRPMERGPNNRTFHYALATEIAAQEFPSSSEAKRWHEYAEAAWQDWWVPGDTYEPGYVAHNFDQVIELGLLLGHQKELSGERAHTIYLRYRDHVAPSGNVVQPGDGQFSADYVSGLALAATLTGDPTLLWAAERALVAARPNPARLPAIKRDFEQARDALAKRGIVPLMPPPALGVQSIFAASHPAADRLLLNASRQPDRPYAAFYVQDAAETTYHSHEDNRGEIYHYESGGRILLRRPGWIKWAGAANTFVVGDAADEFPLVLNRPLSVGHWYRGSGNLRVFRQFQPDDFWNYNAPTPVEGGAAALNDAKRNLGYSWTNPAVFAGKFDRLQIHDLTLRFVAIPRTEAEAAVKKKDHYLQTLSFDPALAWYREYRAVAPTDGYEVEIGPVRLAGPKGEQILCDPARDWKSFTYRHYPPGSRADARKIRDLDAEEIAALAHVVEVPGRGAVLRLKIPPGRLDLGLAGLKIAADVQRDYPRLEMDYCLGTGAEAFLRAPLTVAVNGLRPRSFYLDGQQGGRLASASADRQGDDVGGVMDYAGVWTADSAWKRRAVLTGEGALVVLDEFTPGDSAKGLAGGPVWQMAAKPVGGAHWFVAPLEDHPEDRLLVYFHPGPGVRFGTQFQPKILGEQNDAVFARTEFSPGRTVRFLSVLRPLFGDAKEFAAPPLTTTLAPDGEATVVIPRDSADPIRVTLTKDGGWSVQR